MEKVQVGRTVIRLAPGFKITRLPWCSHCHNFAPDCRCGHPKLYKDR